MATRRKRNKKFEDKSEISEEYESDQSKNSRQIVPERTINTRSRTSRVSGRPVLPIKRSYAERDFEYECDNDKLLKYTEEIKEKNKQTGGENVRIFKRIIKKSSRGHWTRDEVIQIGSNVSLG